jgi:N-acetylmuramoyl-L-alanine amidase
MKSVILWLLVLAFWPNVAHPQNGVRAPEQIQIAGREYVRLTDWTRANDYEVRWLKREETVQASSEAFRLLLTVDSCKASLNGVQVWLLSPIVFRNGTVYIDQRDLRVTLHPLLSPTRNSRSMSPVREVCLDPGHGGKDPGFCVGSNEEKKITLLLAQEVRRQLIHAGLKVTLTRTSDSTVELPDRPEIAQRRKADLLVSLHFNAAQASANSVQGTEIYCLTPAGADSTNGRAAGDDTRGCPGNQFNERNIFLAYQLQRSMTQNLGVEDRGVRRARFWVLRDALMPAVLIEAGYMSHPMEGRRILDADYRRQVAHAIVEGVLAYKREVEVSPDLKAARHRESATRRQSPGLS